jgi:hypothetical protein
VLAEADVDRAEAGGDPVVLAALVARPGVVLLMGAAQADVGLLAIKVVTL